MIFYFLTVDFQWSLCPWFWLLGSVRNGSYLCSLVGGVHSERLWPTPVHHCCSAQPLLLLHHSPRQWPQRMRDPSFGQFEGGETGFRVTNSIPFLLKQYFHFIIYIRHSGRGNKTFLLKHFSFHLNLYFLFPYCTLENIPNFTEKQRNSKTSPAELWEISKFP